MRRRVGIVIVDDDERHGLVSQHGIVRPDQTQVEVGRVRLAFVVRRSHLRRRGVGVVVGHGHSRQLLRHAAAHAAGRQHFDVVELAEQLRGVQVAGGKHCAVGRDDQPGIGAGSLRGLCNGSIPGDNRAPCVVARPKVVAIRHEVPCLRGADGRERLAVKAVVGVRTRVGNLTGCVGIATVDVAGAAAIDVFAPVIVRQLLRHHGRLAHAVPRIGEGVG